jgi:hypothetical protein
MAGLVGPGTFYGLFGAGTDTGPLPPVATRDLFIGGNLSLNPSSRFASSGSRLYVRGRLTIDSTGGDQHGIVANNGANASVSTQGSTAGGAGGGGNFFPGGGAGGAGGVGVSSGNGTDPTSGVSTTDSLGGNGGTAGAGGVGLARGNPGTANVVPEPYARYRTLTEALSGVLVVRRGNAVVAIVPSGGAGGAGGGHATASVPPLSGGGGGGGAGAVYVCAAEIVLIGSNPHFSAHGGDGDSGSVVGATGAGGGGGGGPVILVTSKLTGDLNVNFQGGASPSLGANGHQPGLPGSPGNFFLFEV